MWSTIFVQKFKFNDKWHKCFEILDFMIKIFSLSPETGGKSDNTSGSENKDYNRSFSYGDEIEFDICLR